MVAGAFGRVDHGKHTTADFKRMAKPPLKDDDDIMCGLYVVDNVFYKFCDKDLLWQPVNIRGLDLTFILPDGTIKHENDRNQFILKYQQIVSLR